MATSDAPGAAVPAVASAQAGTGAQAPATANVSSPIFIGGEPNLVKDASTQEANLSTDQWKALNGQRDTLIKFMTKIFAWLNGSVVGLILIGMIMDECNLFQSSVFLPEDRFIGSSVISAMVAATVVQAGLAFITITKFLFPTQGQDGK